MHTKRREEEKDEFYWNPEKSLGKNVGNLAKYYGTRKVAKCLYIALGGYLLLSAVSKLDDRVIAQDTQYATSSLLSGNNSNAILHGVSDAELGKESPTQSLFSETRKEIAITISDDNPNKPSNSRTISYMDYVSKRGSKKTGSKNTIGGSSPTHKLEIDGETYEIFGDIKSEFQVKKVMDTGEVLTFKVKGDRVTFWDFKGKDCDMGGSSMAYGSHYYKDNSKGQKQSTYRPTWDQENKINAYQDHVIKTWNKIKYQVLNLFLGKQAA